MYLSSDAGTRGAGPRRGLPLAAAAVRVGRRRRHGQGVGPQAEAMHVLAQGAHRLCPHHLLPSLITLDTLRLRRPDHEDLELPEQGLRQHHHRTRPLRHVCAVPQLEEPHRLGLARLHHQAVGLLSLEEEADRNQESEFLHRGRD